MAEGKVIVAVKLTKNEQKKQKDALKQYNRYLPTLQLKKQQLQIVIRQSEAEILDLEDQKKKAVEDMDSWIAVYSANTSLPPELSIGNLIKVKTIALDEGNIAGVRVPIFKELQFEDIFYDLRKYPLWVDSAIVALRDVAKYDALISTLKKRIELLNNELRTTSQRVNLFEKVKIPETKENIRIIAIYLQDQQTAAVVRGKIAKKKLVRVG